MLDFSKFKFVSDLINESPISRQQYLVYIVCFILVAVDGFDTAVIGFLAPAIKQEFALGPHSIAMLITAGLLGAITGTSILGPAADRFGRTRVMLIATFVYGALTVLLGVLQSFEAVLVVRFLAGICFGGVLPCAIALTAEYAPQRKRSSVITAMFCGFTIGSASVGFIAAWMLPILGWRAVLVTGGSLALLVGALCWMLLPESLSFLVSRTPGDSAINRILGRIAPAAVAAGWIPEPEPAPQGRPLKALFETRPVSGTFLLWVGAFAALMCTYLLANWLPVLLTQEGYSMSKAAVVAAMFQVGGTIGSLSIGVAMDRARPNRVLAGVWAFSALALCGIALLTPTPIAVAVAIFFAGVCIPGGQIGSSAYAAAWYPTQVRTTGISWMSGIGRCGALVGSLIAGGLLALGLGMQVIVALLGIPMLLAALSMFLHERVYHAPSKAHTLALSEV